MFKVRFSEKARQLIVSKSEQKNYYELLDTQALEIFLPNEYTYQIVDEDEPADICIVGIQHTDNSLLRSNEYNIFLSVENFSVGRTHYQHWNKFGRNSNPMISTYIYNDIPHPLEHIIPTVYYRVKYFNTINPKFEHIRNSVPFDKKKFCLFTSRNGLNSNKHKVVKQLSQLGEIDFLDKYDAVLKDKSCYNSSELISLYSQYKFIICFENSTTPGYVTEKIFNVFLSGTIPIYDGAPNIKDYINPQAFIQYNTTAILSKISLIMQSEELYNAIVSKEKTKDIDYDTIGFEFDTQIENKIMNKNCLPRFLVNPFGSETTNDNVNQIQTFSVNLG